MLHSRRWVRVAFSLSAGRAMVTSSLPVKPVAVISSSAHEVLTLENGHRTYREATASVQKRSRYGYQKVLELKQACSLLDLTGSVISSGAHEVLTLENGHRTYRETTASLQKRSRYGYQKVLKLKQACSLLDLTEKGCPFETASFFIIIKKVYAF